MSKPIHAVDQEMFSDQPSDTGGIQLVPRYTDDIGHPNCLVVAPFRKSAQTPTIMATVEHYREKLDPKGFPWTILPVTEEALVLKAAVEAAVKYAEDNDIRVIFLNQNGFSTTAERQQTDTKALNTGVPSAR